LEEQDTEIKVLKAENQRLKKSESMVMNLLMYVTGFDKTWL